MGSTLTTTLEWIRHAAWRYHERPWLIDGWNRGNKDVRFNFSHNLNSGTMTRNQRENHLNGPTIAQNVQINDVRVIVYLQAALVPLCI